MRIPAFVSLVLLASACGGDDGTNPPVDAAGAVVRVTCGGATIAGTVTAPGFAFEPMATTINAGQIVQFTMPSTHNAVSDSGAFRADFNASTCFQFNVAATYAFHCEPHLFTGSIVVQ